MPRVHINGFACRGPGFSTATELSSALFEQRDMASCSMEGKECFDHTFFRVPAKQAAATDPQIRALLELTYAALVEAGVNDFSALPRERAGVYVGSSFGDFQHSVLADGSRVEGYEHIGAAGNMLANSVSRFFQFGGPSMKIDTACSSSLTALDIACNDIRSGRCELAVVAGCNLTLNPAVTRVYQQMGIVCQQDRPQCMPFSENAAGYVRKEAIVVLVVSSLPQLQAEGVMASAEVLANVSMCGSGESVCSPSVSTQEVLYQRVAAMAAPLIELHGERVAYVECHATGTLVGDAAETQALVKVSSSVPIFRRDSTDAPPLLIGSVKSAVGHTESASGLLGMVKVLLALEQGELPPDRHYTHAHRNRSCDGLGDGILKVVTEPTPIARDAIVVVNSFGFGGTHTQVMVRGITPPHRAKGASDDAFCPDEAACSTREPWMCINPVLARSEATAQVVAHSTRQHHFALTVAPPEVHQGDFRARAFTTAVSRLTHTSTAAVQPMECHPVWLVFAGEGGQWAEMGSDLYQRSPVYKATFDECAAYVLDVWQCDAMQRLLHDAAHGPFRDALDATICLVGVQVCLVTLLRQAGVTSDSCAGCIGYSSGEIAAGYFDGCYSLQTTLDIAVLRGRAAAHASSYHEGSMCAVQGLSREQIDDEIRSSMTNIEVACHTAEQQISVSGVASELSAFEAWVRDRHPHARVERLQTYGVAFHSRQLDEALPQLQRDLDALLPAGVEARSHGWVPGCGAQDDPTRGSSFHCRGIRECVEFYRACQRIPPHSMVIECGSSAMLHSSFPEERYTYLSLLRRGEDAVETLSAAYGQLFLHDFPLSPLTGQHCSPRVAFPTPAQRSLREAFLVFDHSEKFSQYLYPITKIGAELEYGPAQHSPTLRKSFHFDVEGRARWLRDHRVDGRCLFPTAGYLYMMCEMSPGQECVILEFKIHAPVDMLECSSFEFCVELSQNEALHHRAGLQPTSSEFDVRSKALVYVATLSSASRELVASAWLEAHVATHPATPSAFSAACPTSDGADLLYHQLGRHGYDYRSSFRVLSNVREDKSAARVRSLQANCEDNEPGRKVRILALEGILQFAIIRRIGENLFGPCCLPVSIDRMSIIGSGQLARSGEKGFNVWVDRGGLAVESEQVRLEGLHVKARSSSLPGAFVSDASKVELVPLPTPADCGEGQHGLPRPLCEGDAVLYLEAELDTWHSQIRRLHKQPVIAGHVLLVSAMAGFSGFVRSLQKESGFQQVRGLQLLEHEAAAITRLPDVLIQRARDYFARDDKVASLFVRQGEAGEDYDLLDEALRPAQSLTFMSPHGCYFAQSTDCEQSVGTWKAICSPGGSASEERQTILSISVAFASLNFRDVMIAHRGLDRHKAIKGYGCTGGGFGLDFAGHCNRLQPGTGRMTKVIGLGRDCIGTALLEQPEYLCWELPEDAELEAFATVPCAYATAYYALCVRGRLQSDSTVLVHCGAGGVGLAALHICRRRLTDPDSQLFVTCGTDAKKQYLVRNLQIPIDNIGDSQSSNFEAMVMGRTNRRGVSMALNSLTGELSERTVACLSFGGVLLELGKKDMKPSVLEQLRLGDKGIMMIDLDQIMAHEATFEVVRRHLSDGLRSGEVVPLPRTVFVAPGEIGKAFECMSSRERIGKVVVQISHDSLSPDVPSLAATMPTRQDAEAQAFVIVGGLGGLGLCLAQWITSHFGPACRIILCGRGGAYKSECAHVLRHLSSRVEVRAGDFSQYSEVARLLEHLRSEENPASLVGFFNAAASLKDVAFKKMSTEAWETPFASKVDVTQNFVRAVDVPEFENVCKNLQYFVCFSSVVAGLGNASQTNYACANAAMEQLVIKRAALGKPGLCVRLGLVPHVGLATSVVNAADTDHLRPISLHRVLLQLERLIASNASGLFAVYSEGILANSSSPFAQGNLLTPAGVQAELLKIIRDQLDCSASDEELLNMPMGQMPGDSLVITQILNAVRAKVGSEWISRQTIAELTPLVLANKIWHGERANRLAIATVPSAHIITVATIPSLAGDGEMKAQAFRALVSLKSQSRAPDVTVLVFEDTRDHTDEALVAELKKILPHAKLVVNERTRGFYGFSSSGALNTGIIASSNDEKVNGDSWISILDTATSIWRPTHLHKCLSMAEGAAGKSCQLVMAASWNQARVLPRAEERAFFVAHVEKSCLFVRRNLMMEAGMFDEALCSRAATDLYVRLLDVLAGENLLAQPISSAEVTESTVDGTASKAATHSKSDMFDDFDLFLYKHTPRMTSEQLELALSRRTSSVTVRPMPETSSEAGEREFDLVQLPMWDPQHSVAVRRDVFDTVQSCTDKRATLAPKLKLLFGIITSNPERVSHLLRDLGYMLNDKKHCVVVYVNAIDLRVADEVSHLLQSQKSRFRGHVIRSDHRLVKEMLKETHGSSTNGIPLPIAMSRTVLQTFLCAITDAEPFDAVAVLDDDMRLPQTWSLREGDDAAGDILNGRAIKTPPNPTVMSMRTQMLDFLFALDLMHSARDHKICVEARAPQKIFSNLQDQYYDLSSSRWDHLEMPRQFYCNEPVNSFVKQCRKRILVGDPLAREAVSTEDGRTTQRGGCMVLFHKSFNLLRMEQMAPQVRLSSGKTVASRRSDSFWVQRHCSVHDKVSVVRRHLSVLHDNMHDKIPSTQTMRETVALEMIGAIICRPPEQRVSFSHSRVHALQCSLARMRGICKVLRSRPYFESMPELSSFIDYLEMDLLNDEHWRREVLEVIERNVTTLEEWIPYAQRSVERVYALSDSERRSILGDCTPVFPDAASLHLNPGMAIPCLHRIHNDDEELKGAHYIQNCIGMSISRSYACDRLRQLARLSEVTAGWSTAPTRKALVTMDDGFRDVMLLRPTFRELADYLQPVLFLPSAQLGGNPSLQRRQLPLVCLYEHCFRQGIDNPDDIDKLGAVRRSVLKAFSESEQYERLERAGIPTDLDTDDLLTIEDLHELAGEGWWICSHGPDHSDLTRARSFQSIEKALLSDFELIRRNGWTPWFAWPEGRWCARIADALARQREGPTAQFGLTDPLRDEASHPAVIRRVAWLGGGRAVRVLVTGSEGFLGRHLCLVLRAHGFDVFEYDFARGHDILDKKNLTRELRDRKIDACVHLAAQADLYEAEKQPDAAWHTNVDGTRSVLECCNMCDVRMLFASTCCAYGNNKAHISNEMSPTAPTELYATTKLEGEAMILASDRTCELFHVVMRLATFYGPEMRGSLATAQFLQAAAVDGVINIHGTGEQTRCFTHVHDIADGIRVLLCAKDFSGVVNVADDREYSVNELARVVMSVSRPCTVKYEQDREGQIQRSKICNKRLRELGTWGWRPTVSLENGMRDCARRLGKWPIPALIDDKFTKATYDTIAYCRLERTSLPITCGLIGQIYTTDILMDGTQLVAYVVGDLRHAQLVAVRIHSECLFGDVFGSLKCDCGAQLQMFFTCIAKERHGILVYVKGHEGRGAGLMTKTRAYRDVDQNPSKHHNDALLDAGAASIDSRCYSAAAALVVRLICEANDRDHAHDKGRPSCSSSKERIHLVLYTNNRQKVEAVEKATQHCGAALPRLHCAQRTMPADSTCNRHNQKYLFEKIGNGHEGLCVLCPDVVPAVVPEDNLVGAALHCPTVDDVPGMATEENIDVFDAGDPKLFDFYKEHGFAVIRGLISEKQIEAGLCLHESNVLRLFEKVNARIGDGQVTFDEFELGVSQFRDLFLNDATNNVFRPLTCDEGPTSMSTVAQRAMDALDPEGQWTGMKLLHDHIIVKPARGASKKIPLHQDTMFWPVDVPACSTWTALTDAPINGGCMEIVSLKTKPHQRKQNVCPVDFMDDENNSGLALLLQDDPTPKRWLLPMRAGDTLLFSSHTWHRSSVNKQSQQKRVAYIQTWVHPRAAWRPDLVPWHPVNEHLKKAGHTPGSELSGERHPRTGCTSCGGMDYMKSRYARTSSITKTATKQAGSSISMFDASDIVSTQIFNILTLHGNIKKPDSLVDHLKDPTCREMLVKITCDMFYQSPEAPPSELQAELATESGCKTISELLSWTLKQILISTAAYEYDRSRNVFNSAYAAWWKIAGEQWNQHFTMGNFYSEYRLCKTDVSAFLKAIHVDREKYSRSTDGKLQLLQAIIYGCMEHVPFQNITMLTRIEPGRDQRYRPPTLGQIIDDMTKGLGGLCTTRNPFLFLLLNALEFDDVRFVCASITQLAGPILEHAHIALLVRVGTIDYWVDVANGFPYMQPLALDADCSAVIEHPFADTRLIRRTSTTGDVLWVVQHQLHTTGQEDWNDNYFFSTMPVDYATGFASMREKHYDPQANYGPFLTHLRLNMWSATAGVLLRDDNLALIDGGRAPETNELQTINMWDASEELSELAAMLTKCAFTVDLKITELVPEAWARCQMHRGVVQEAEKVTVTGGFFDNSADGYIGVVTVWRSQSTSNVVGLTFRVVNVYTPEMLPVINKGFAGASWYNNELYVCWPNRIAVVTPKSGWAIQSHIDDKRFNDLHHVHACSEGVWVANTGQDSVDHLTFDGDLVSRTHVCRAPQSLEDTETDMRDQIWHDKLRGRDKEHVNYVTVALGGLGEPESPSALPSDVVMVAATLLNSKQVVNIQEKKSTTPNELIAKLDATKPPHEGFLAAAPWDPQKYFWWNSTVDGCVVATDCVSGRALQWNLCEHSELPRGWTRGLCLLRDGFLVGSTAIHAGSEEWIEKHHNTWNFDTTRSRTTVSFVPFASSESRDGSAGASATAAPKSVHFLNARHAKIFSLLMTPTGVSHHASPPRMVGRNA